jgi:hypothetical protein
MQMAAWLAPVGTVKLLRSVHNSNWRARRVFVGDVTGIWHLPVQMADALPARERVVNSKQLRKRERLHPLVS